MRQCVLGLDIGGANLKAATADGQAAQQPFALWKQPEHLTIVLRHLIQSFADVDCLAVTMTAELCDCFQTKRDGVQCILDAVQAAAGRRPVFVWHTSGTFLEIPIARQCPLEVAAANWHALATFACRLVPESSPALLVDIGSTTSDLVPILAGKVVARGKTDPDRLAVGELVYTGVRRTPLCSLLGPGHAAEFFASTLDVYVTLGHIAEDPSCKDTADGRPATKLCAHARLARMVCGDTETVSGDAARNLAQSAHKFQVRSLKEAAWSVFQTLPAPPQAIVLSGSGEFLGEIVLDSLDFQGTRLRLSEQLGPTVSACACAYALAVLASQG